MFKKSHLLFSILILFFLTISSELKAEINFDFGLPLYRQKEVNFEKTKPADYNFQLLKKYILEHKDNVIAQYHAIVRWFTLIKLSDTPKHDELIKLGNEYFSLKNKEKPTIEEKLRGIFYSGVLLSTDKEENPDCKKEQQFEEILLENEDSLCEKAEYWIAKGILFQVLKNRSNNYFSLMKPEEDLKIALTLIPRISHYYYVMGQCFRFLGSSDSALFLAIASYEKAASLEPKNPKLQNSLLGIYMGLHEEYQSKGKTEPFWLEEAVYKKIMEIAPNNPYALNNLGYLYAEYGVNTKVAEEYCQKAVKLSPDNAGFQDSLGWAAFKNKNYKLAEEALLKSISLKKTIYESHYHLATLYYSINNYPKAAEQYEESLKIRPDSAEALNNLAYLYTELNTNSEKALTMAQKANKIEPNNASYLDTLGWAYYRNEDIDNALTYLLKADSLAPAQSEILLHIGRVYLEKNEFDKALAYVKEAFKVNPNQNDPEETLYLTVRVKAYHEALGNYHGLLGEKADKTKVLNILMGLSRLYQEEGLFDKSIEITKICSELNSGEKDLKNPLLNTYKLHKKEEKDSNKNIEKTLDADLKEESKENKEENQNNEKDSIKTEQKLQSTDSKEGTHLLLQNLDYPMAISFCGEFFKFLHGYFPKMKELTKCNVTIIPDRLLFPHKTAIVRISSDSLSGKDIKDGIMAAYYFNSIATSTVVNDIERTEIDICSDCKIYCVTLDHSFYFSCKQIEQESLASLSYILPYNESSFMELYYDNQAFLNRFPKFINGFIKNPFRPFEKLQASYKITDEGINEFIVATTGKVEDEEFIKKIAGRLFRFKIRLNKKNLNTTIKMKSEKELIFISTEFENLFDWARKKINFTNRVFRGLFPILFKRFPLIK